MKRYLLLASVAGCLLNAGNAWAGIETDAQSATLTASVSLKSAHVLGGTTAINFGTLMLKRDQIPTDGSVVTIAHNGAGGFETMGTYVQAASGTPSTASMTIDGLHASDSDWENLGDINVTWACNRTFVEGKGCKISDSGDDLQVYVAVPDDDVESVTNSVEDILNNASTSSLFTTHGLNVNLNVEASKAAWEDLTLTDVAVYRVTLDY